MEKLYSFASALLVVFLSCTTAQSPLPVLSDCSPCWCDSAGNCPDPREVCPEILNCNTGVVKDKCGCCYVCLKSIGEMCKREPYQKDEERCDQGLQCLPGEDTWKCEDFKPENLKISRCEKSKAIAFIILWFYTLCKTSEGVEIQFLKHRSLRHSLHTSTLNHANFNLNDFFPRQILSYGKGR